MIQIDAETARFLASPVMIILGTADSLGRPAIGRGLGCRFHTDGRMELAFSRWQWPRTAADIAATGQLAATWARPSDYVSYQLKGRAELREAGPGERDAAQRYCSDVSGVLTGLGVAPEQVAHWLTTQDLVLARLTVTEAYIQTPGQRAGVAL
ncbi:pyridoxamine 5'-phosphate oxidase family protein [Bosea caraganae]|uniref:pyridoxamine 5'-phosphate oxidase family protein n=1 Tax=Bosea caraganae TaxID=2763117 RepID=UPI000E0BE397|nr:pyridoxamine 5'-phosphate oxidase family protein [Bosea caraganae]